MAALHKQASSLGRSQLAHKWVSALRNEVQVAFGYRMSESLKYKGKTGRRWRLPLGVFEIGLVITCGFFKASVHIWECFKLCCFFCEPSNPGPFFPLCSCGTLKCIKRWKMSRFAISVLQMRKLKFQREEATCSGSHSKSVADSMSRLVLFPSQHRFLEPHCP